MSRGPKVPQPGAPCSMNMGTALFTDRQPRWVGRTYPGDEVVLQVEVVQPPQLWEVFSPNLTNHIVLKKDGLDGHNSSWKEKR